MVMEGKSSRKIGKGDGQDNASSNKNLHEASM